MKNHNLIQLKTKSSQKIQSKQTSQFSKSFLNNQQFYSYLRKTGKLDQIQRNGEQPKCQINSSIQLSSPFKDLPNNQEFWNYIQNLDQTNPSLNHQQYNNYVFNQCFVKLNEHCHELNEFQKAQLFLSLLKVMKFIDNIPQNMTNQDYVHLSFESDNAQYDYLKIDSVFKEFQFRQKIGFFFDFIDQFWEKFRKNNQFDICEQKRQKMQSKQKKSFQIMKFYIRKKKYVLHQECFITAQQLAKMFLRLFLVIDSQNKHQKPSEILQKHLQQIIQKKQLKEKQDAIQSRLKYYQFSKNLKIYQNQGIIRTFFKITIFKGPIKEYIQNLKQIFHPHSSYNQYCQRIRHQKYHQAENNQNIILPPQRQDSLINCYRVSFSKQEQIVDTIDEFSRINSLYTQMSRRKRNIIQNIKKRDVIYKKHIYLNRGMICFSLEYNLFDIQQFSTYNYQEIESLDLGGNDLKLEGIQILTSMRWPNLKILQIWRNNIKSLEGSGLQKMANLTSFSATFNPLKIDTVQYLLRHKWQDLEQIRLQFIDGNTSWPILCKKITTPFPKLSRMRIGKQGFIGTSQPLNESTKNSINLLQIIGIQVF